MKPITVSGFVLLLLSLSSILSCSEKREVDRSYDPQITPANFSRPTEITNRYFLFEPGKTYVYEGKTEEGMERGEVRLTTMRKTVMGIDVAVVSDKVTVDGKLIEAAEDWYAQDNSGTVWYMGERVENYGSDGKLMNTDGSWEAGVDGAKPGIAMLADPKAGTKYRQEYYFNEAEDSGEVVELGLQVTTPLRTFESVLKTKDTNPLEEDATEFKYYAPGVGLIKEENPAEKEELFLIRIQE